MTSSSYKNYLVSKAWKKKKNQISSLSFTGRKCKICGNEKTDLHHKTYKNFTREKDYDLVFLCRFHHFEVHKFCKDNNFNIWNGTEKYISMNKKILNRKPKWDKHMINIYFKTGKIPTLKEL